VSTQDLKVAVIGGGAAGFFAALSAKQHHPSSQVTIYEKTSKLLSKVKVSGGGRCNVTNGSTSITEVARAYPRGAKLMKKALRVFNTKDTQDWFESRGVPLKIESDGRVFPQADDSQKIIDCLMKEVVNSGIEIKKSTGVVDIGIEANRYLLRFKNDTVYCDKLIIATGGGPTLKSYDWMSSLEHHIVDPIPSLFTFNMPDESIVKLMGVVAPNVSISIQGGKLKSRGPLLITHWGMSGPAILKLSAFGARELQEVNYKFVTQVNWINISNNDEVRQCLEEIVAKHPKKKISNLRPFNLPDRLWSYLLTKCSISVEKPWQEIGKKALNKLTTVLTNDTYHVKGKTTFKEEFVTCGGVGLSNIDHDTMQSKNNPNVYYAGEVLDIDGITGGYNFQAAWSTGYIAGRLG